MTPARAEDLAPPASLRSSPRWLEVIGQKTSEHERPPVALGVGDVASRTHELNEPRVGDGVGVDPERLERDGPYRSFSVGGEPDRIVQFP